MNIRRTPPNRIRAQHGSVLVVAIILLLLASVITLLTLNVGLFEQRTSGNDSRAKLIAEVAEAGIAQGAEYFRLRPAALNPSTNWQLCNEADTSFPCGSIPDVDVDCDADGDGDPTTSPCPVSRRATMYRWVNQGSPGDVNNDGVSNNTFDMRMLPLNQVLTGTAAPARISAVGGFDQVSYGVGVVLCRIALPKSAASATRCATDPAEQSSTYVYNFVSVAGLPGENTRTTVSQMLGQYAIFNAAPNKPPVVASGSVDVTGGLQIVTNPNAAGTGVPVSVWTRKDITKTGTPNTCYFDEFIRYGAKNNDPATVEGGVVVCDTCNCEGDKSLSYDKSGNLQDEGIDILDIDGDNGENRDVKPEEFPCDLFQFVFGKQVRTDNDADYFCETMMAKESYTKPDGTTIMLDPDEAYLYSNSDTIIPRATAYTDGTLPSAVMKPAQAATLTYPAAGFSGIVWCQTNCDVGSNQQMGTPEKPVLLVIDGAAKIQGRIFGLVFLRSTGAILDPGTGGTATLDMNAGAAVYGSVVVQGQIDKANGTAAIIYSDDVFKNLANSLAPKNSSLPGAWTDRLSY